jgi:hypothetical protein
LEDQSILSGLDMLVLTGLTNSFDRMLHLAAYARTKNPKVIVVAWWAAGASSSAPGAKVF